VSKYHPQLLLDQYIFFGAMAFGLLAISPTHKNIFLYVYWVKRCKLVALSEQARSWLDSMVIINILRSS
jgi:hypothetical protein